MTVRILIGDVRERLKELADESVHCVVTSPPYWGLRDYGIGGQLGLEPTLAEHVAVMVDVFREVRRVLKSTGTLWLNYGDSYAASSYGSGGGRAKAPAVDGIMRNNRSLMEPFKPKNMGGLKPKDLCGVPWRVAFALQADGWWLRQDIIWSKPNPMPESVTDRCTKAHEYVFLMTKAPRYFYDAEAIAEDSTRSGEIPGGSKKHTSDDVNDCRIRQGLTAHAQTPVNATRNKRSVWEIATAPFSEAHFATFPPALVETCLKAGCPSKCCSKCGAGWVRQTEPSERYAKYLGKGFTDHSRDAEAGMMQNRGVNRQNAMIKEGITGRENVTLGFSPSCKCNADTVPGLVLDPFGGAGTTGLVADRLGMDAVLIELNPAYAEIARKRIHGDLPMFAQVEAVA